MTQMASCDHGTWGRGVLLRLKGKFTLVKFDIFLSITALCNSQMIVMVVSLNHFSIRYGSCHLINRILASLQ